MLLRPSSRLLPAAIIPLLLLPSSSIVFAMSSSTTPGFEAPKSVVVIGGGIQGTSVAYHLATHPTTSSPARVTLLEAKAPASAASGKGGGFMARSWGDGGSTQQLHHVAFDMYENLSNELDCKTYRKLPVLSVSPGKGGINAAKRKNKQLKQLLPSWLDGNTGRIGTLGVGDDTAQITPSEFVSKMIDKGSLDVVLGKCVGITSEDVGSDGGMMKKVTGVKYTPRDTDEEKILECDAVVVSAGPWSCAAEDWFDGIVELPMEGIKSTSIVWKKPEGGKEDVDATALFCGEDHRFGTHLEVYPRPDNTIYICGIGGSDYITKTDLQSGAYLEQCDANESRVEAASKSFHEISKLYKNEGELEKVQACMRPCPPDAKPYMGQIDGFVGGYINAGHNCWGIAWAPACGKAMSELVLDGKSECIDLSPFDPSRFTTPPSGRGGRGRKRRGTSVGEQW